jgi:hypothetical protein
MELQEEHPSKKDERYLRVLKALMSGPKTSSQVRNEAGFDDPFKCSSALAVLIRRGTVVHGYALTEEGRRKLSARISPPVQALLPERQEPSSSPEPPMPSTKLLSPGFEWVWGGQQWVQRRKLEFRIRTATTPLFG